MLCLGSPIPKHSNNSRVTLSRTESTRCLLVEVRPIQEQSEGEQISEKQILHKCCVHDWIRLSAMVHDILSEFLKPQSELWPEVKMFLSLCKTAAQRLPREVQVSNIMNVSRGIKRLSRLKGEEDPSEVQALLQWIVDRSEIAGAFCLQRLKTGHQVSRISFLYFVISGR